MQIRLLAFAQARSVLGFDQQTITAPDNATPESILNGVRSDWRTALPACRVAIDLEYADWQQPLREGQEVAILPPVSGG